ncbi:MAG: undecaprenyl-diphosphate phosphatase [Turicibacter sp.]|nr:undecaprenyl-diphosphate phosphatase [Turicibacter sp.]
MTIWQAMILGVVQGIAEFLPISSSGHLIVLGQVLGVEENDMTFSIIVHLGSLCAVFAVFWRDILSILKKPLQKLTGLLILGTLPAVIVGFTIRDFMYIFEQPFLLAAAFAFTGILLLIADNIKHATKTFKEMTALDAIIVGLMQAVALVPGISRSGATITGALVTGLNRETAARFSFLLSIIAILGAGTLEAIDVVMDATVIYYTDIPAYMLGFVTAAVSGYFSIRILLNLISKAKLRYFAYYVFALALFILADFFILGLFFS